MCVSRGFLGSYVYVFFDVVQRAISLFSQHVPSIQKVINIWVATIILLHIFRKDQVGFF